jgi:hypothetical protein
VATESRGERATPRRVAELQADDARLEARIELLEAAVDRLNRRLEAVVLVSRARIGAELTALKELV